MRDKGKGIINEYGARDLRHGIREMGYGITGLQKDRHRGTRVAKGPYRVRP